MLLGSCFQPIVGFAGGLFVTVCGVQFNVLAGGSLKSYPEIMRIERNPILRETPNTLSESASSFSHAQDYLFGHAAFTENTTISISELKEAQIFYRKFNDKSHLT